MAGQLPCARECREETNLWTTVKMFLENPQSVPEPEVSCPVCYIEIAIRGLPSQSPCPWKISGGSQRVGVALPCAHILCQECSQGHFDRLNYANLPPACPVCRFSVQHDVCRHVIVPKRLPIASYEDAAMVPLTVTELPEDDKVLPGQCLPCLQSTVVKQMRTGLDHIAQTVRPSVAADSQWNQVATHMHSVMEDFVHDQKMGPHWEFMASSDASLHVAFIDDVQTVGVLPPEVRYTRGDKIVCLPSSGAGDDDQAYWLVPCARVQGTQ